MVVSQNYATAFRHFSAGAEAGDALCMTQLGTMYGKGNYVERDPWKAAEYYRRASEEGDVLGTSNLGWCYANGAGVEKDLKEEVILRMDVDFDDKITSADARLILRASVGLEDLATFRKET